MTRIMKRALIFLAAALAVVLLGMPLIALTWHTSMWQGFYCSAGLATTVGCDAEPESFIGQFTKLVIVFTAIPLMAAAFSDITNIKIHKHIDKVTKEQNKHIEKVVQQHESEEHGGVS